MTFTRSDLTTFIIGMAAAVAIAIGQALVEFDAAAVADDPKPFLLSLTTGVVTALGRWLATRIPELLASRALRPPPPSAETPCA